MREEEEAAPSGSARYWLPSGYTEVPHSGEEARHPPEEDHGAKGAPTEAVGTSRKGHHQGFCEAEAGLRSRVGQAGPGLRGGDGMWQSFCCTGESHCGWNASSSRTTGACRDGSQRGLGSLLAADRRAGAGSQLPARGMDAVAQGGLRDVHMASLAYSMTGHAGTGAAAASGGSMPADVGAGCLGSGPAAAPAFKISAMVGQGAQFGVPYWGAGRRG